MPTITVKDGTEIFYSDFGKGQPIVFSHGWPLSGEDWENQILFFGQQGYRLIAHDRRGHGRSTQTWDGNDMDTYSDDLAALFETLDLKDVIMVGHSTGGGEVARFLGRHGVLPVRRCSVQCHR
jgi:non-heme chloroperoxidase